MHINRHPYLNDPRAIANSVLPLQSLQSLPWAMLLATAAPSREFLGPPAI